MGIKTSPDIHQPVKRIIYNVIKSPFVHAKSKELFQENTHTITVQLFDAEEGVMLDWMKRVNESLPAGIDFDCDLYRFVDEDEIRDIVHKNTRPIIHDGTGSLTDTNITATATPMDTNDLTFNEQVLLKKQRIVDLLSK